MGDLLQRPKVILIDVYETILDMSELQKKLNYLMDNRGAYGLWLDHLVEQFTAVNDLEKFVDFETLAIESMQHVAGLLSTRIKVDDLRSLLDLLRYLPLKEGVQEGLSELSNLNFRLVAFTNISTAVINERMQRTGLISYFEKVLSVDKCGKYKPHSECYQWAAKTLATQPDEILMVSAHNWDIAGAASAGMNTAIIGRSKYEYKDGKTPADYQIENLEELVSVFSESKAI